MSADGLTPELLEALRLRKGMSGADLAHFWLTDPLALTPSSAFLGCRPVEADPGRGFARNAFPLRPELLNPLGALQGGFIAAMLDDTVSIGALITIGGDYVVPTLEMKISFFKPVMGREAFAEGGLVKRGKTIVFMEGQMVDEAGDLCARISSTAMLREIK
jgi:uncharacterized protein (TIGR00369 family)